MKHDTKAVNAFREKPLMRMFLNMPQYGRIEFTYHMVYLCDKIGPQ